MSYTRQDHIDFVEDVADMLEKGSLPPRPMPIMARALRESLAALSVPDAPAPLRADLSALVHGAADTALDQTEALDPAPKEESRD
jgi:hypothetical protein